MTNQKYDELQCRLIDYIQLSPTQRYIKYRQFPWASIMTLCLVFVTTLMVETVALGSTVQQRNIQVFFNYHILQHQNFDIYEDSDIFTIRTQQYMDFEDISDFFNRTLQVLSNINQYNFYESNQSHIDCTAHSIKRYYQDEIAQKVEMTLNQMIQSQNFTLDLKPYLEDLKRMQLIFHLNNLTINIKQLDLIIIIDFLKKFQIKVTLDTKVIKDNFKQTNRKDLNQSEQKGGNLKVRKLPPHHHQTYSPFNVEYFFRFILILLSFHEGIRRILIYRQHSFPLRGITSGQPWARLPLLKKCKLIGWWNIITIIINIIGITGRGPAVFTAWSLLVRYLQYTQNPYIITFLLKNILRIMMVVIITTFFVLTGFVVFSMVKFSSDQKFEQPQIAYFNYVFNNFQYGIYENFMSIQQYGGFYQTLYFIFCFYMVWCTNNMVPSIICNTVINKNRLKYLSKFFKNIRIACPVCQHITNQQAEKAVKQTYGVLDIFSINKQTQVQMKIQSPKILPFLSPKLLPASKMKIRKHQSHKDTISRTKFQIVEQLDTKLDLNSTQLFSQKIQLLRKKIDQCLLQMDIYGNGHNPIIEQKLTQTNQKLNYLKGKINKRIKIEQQKIQSKKALGSKKSLPDYPYLKSNSKGE